MQCHRRNSRNRFEARDVTSTTVSRGSAGIWGVWWDMGCDGLNLSSLGSRDISRYIEIFARNVCGK